MTPPRPAHLMPRGFSRALEPVMDASLGRGQARPTDALFQPGDLVSGQATSQDPAAVNKKS